MLNVDIAVVKSSTIRQIFTFPANNFILLIIIYDFLTIYLYDTTANMYLNACLSARILTLKDLLVCL